MKPALVFLVKTLTDLYLLTFLLRFVMQWVRADFYNPLAQFVVRVTNPLVVPARRLLPSVRSIDAPLLVLLILLEALATWLVILTAGGSVSPADFVGFVVLRLVNLLLWFYTIAIIVYALLSWVGQSYSPIGALLDDLVAPILRPVRRIVPIVGGLDLSPLLVLILIQAARIALPLPGLLR